MGGVVDGAQPLSADVSVALGGGQIGVTQQLLHRPQVGAPVEQVRGERVAQGVGVGGSGRTAVEDAPHVAGREAVAPPVEEQRVAVGSRSATVSRAGPCEPRGAARRRPGSLSGTARCLPPLPHTTARPRSRSRSPAPSAHSSPTRRPLP